VALTFHEQFQYGFVESNVGKTFDCKAHKKISEYPDEREHNDF